VTDLKPVEGREARFAAVYDALYADLLRFAYRRVEPGAAEDVVAEAFLVAWRRFDSLPADDEAARAWLFGVARNVILNDRRGAERREALGVRLAEAATQQTEPADEWVAHRVDVARAWSRLSERHQEALALSVLDGMTSSQAAAVLGISAVAYRLRLSRARRALRLHLEHLPEQPAAAAISERTNDEQLA
jgi:RNA polymerase sigma-70 factor (ECF subfamily)